MTARSDGIEGNMPIFTTPKIMNNRFLNNYREKNSNLILAQSRYTPTQDMSQSWWSICSVIQNISVPLLLRWVTRTAKSIENG